MMPQMTAPDERLRGSLRPRTSHAEKARPAVLLIIFFVMILLPIKPLIGGQRFDPYRLFLLVLFVPFAARVLGGKLGRVTFVDLAVVAFVSDILVSMFMVHGTKQMVFAVSQVLELMGGYLVGRVLIRSAADYQRFIRYFLVVLACMLPFAMFEMLTARMIIADILGHVFPVPEKFLEFRHGLARVQVVFAHPILYGLFCSMALASTIYINKGKFGRQVMTSALVMAATLASLSSAPMISVVLQLGLTFWDKITKGAWKTILTVFLTVILFIQAFSNRGPVVVFIEYVTLDPSTGWWRIFIWQYGWENVMAHPIFGIGLNDWVRPYWMYIVSVDNFWLLMAMRHGLIGLGLILTIFLSHMVMLVRAKGLSPATQAIRTGYTITLVGLMFTIATVHIWDQVAVFVMFFLGAGAFVYTTPKVSDEVPPDEGDEAVEPVDPRAPLPFTRFSHDATRSGPRRREITRNFTRNTRS